MYSSSFAPGASTPHLSYPRLFSRVPVHRSFSHGRPWLSVCPPRSDNNNNITSLLTRAIWLWWVGQSPLSVCCVGHAPSIRGDGLLPFFDSPPKYPKRSCPAVPCPPSAPYSLSKRVNIFILRDTAAFSYSYVHDPTPRPLLSFFFWSLLPSPDASAESSGGIFS